jgi:DeoR/GlpR family transcriptional regulator of sugar metabolism
MLTEERRRRLLELVNARGSLTASDAEKTLAVSRMTIHRDFDNLASQGLVRKVHGGVVALAAPAAAPLHAISGPFEARLASNREAKRAIARQVLKLIGKAHSLVLDGSSTVYFLSEVLPPGQEARDQLIVTGGLPLFNELMRRHDGLRVALHGGEPHPRTGSLVGPLALASLGDMRFDWAVVSAVGLLEHEGNVYVSNAEELEVKRSYLTRARRKILAVDTSKLGRAGAYRLGPLSDFDHVVTEKHVSSPAGSAPPPREKKSARGGR